jgi:hypothetical protein
MPFGSSTNNIPRFIADDLASVEQNASCAGFRIGTSYSKVFDILLASNYTNFEVPEEGKRVPGENPSPGFVAFCQSWTYLHYGGGLYPHCREIYLAGRDN